MTIELAEESGRLGGPVGVLVKVPFRGASNSEDVIPLEELQRPEVDRKKADDTEGGTCD